MAVIETLFISENTLKQDYIVQNNVDPKILTPFVKVAQELHIESLLGIPLTEELKAVVMQGSSAITGNYETILVSYIQPALIQYTIYEALPFLNYKFTNKSIATKSSENSAPVDATDLKMLRQMVLNTGESYKARLKAYLESTARPFPNYYVSDTTGIDCALGNDKNDIYFSGIQLNNNKKRNWNILR